MLSEDRRIAKWNATRRYHPQEKCVADLVGDRAAETPAAPAVVAGDRVVTYEELDTRANALADELRDLGVGPEIIVGVRADRSPEMIVGALAVLKAGGAYLPIDPAYPAERQALMLADAGCGVVLSARGLGGAIGVVEVALDGPHASRRPEPGVCAESLAYVIYTSGSTGAPKGVEVTHGALLNLVFWHRRQFHVSRSDRASQLASVGFDGAVWELWPYLTAGASVPMPDDTTRSDPEALRDWLQSRHITIAFAPTPMAERLMALPWARHGALRALLTGADVLRSRPSRELPFLLVNNYGPTEATVVATSGVVSPDEPGPERPDIGRPIDNTQIHILDAQMRPVPIGAPGELHIGGAGLARGYLNRPELTAERFVAHPFEPGARLYKTGDLARYLPDGRIAFLGRIDDQIKIRGFRVEPNEVVAALDRHRDVAASAVIARDGVLVAYVVPADGSRPTPVTLRRALAAHLPEHVIPAVFVGVDGLPLGPNGKLDRRALPKPDLANTLRDDDYAAPQTEVERRVAALMAPLVGLERVGVGDNFFLLGGHSLLGAQLIARIRDVFGVQMSLRTLFEAPSVAKLSAEIERLLIDRLNAMSEEAAEALLTEPDRADHG